MTERTSAEQEWARQWAATGVVLDEIRARDLRALSDGQALRMIDDLLSTVTSADLPQARRTWSGLVDLQRQLHRRRR